MQHIICHYFSEIYSNDPASHIDQAQLIFPFQLDQEFINGSRFFEMIIYYQELYMKIRNEEHFEKYNSKDDNNRTAYNLIKFLNSYKTRRRTGDIYVRELFDALLVYYVDRFGYEEINKASWKIFNYVYKIRLSQYSVTLATVDNWALNNNLFETIRDAKKSYDITTLPDLTIETKISSNADEDLEKALIEKKLNLNNGDNKGTEH